MFIKLLLNKKKKFADHLKSVTCVLLKSSKSSHSNTPNNQKYNCGMFNGKCMYTIVWNEKTKVKRK